MSDERFIAIEVIARYDGRDRDAIDAAIQTALGCDGNEDECVMVALASTVTGSAESAWEWLHG